MADSVAAYLHEIRSFCADVRATTTQTDAGWQIDNIGLARLLSDRAARICEASGTIIFRWHSEPSWNQAVALEAMQLFAFPVDVWNKRQERNPGGDHRRWHVGEVISSRQLDRVEAYAAMVARIIEDSELAELKDTGDLVKLTRDGLSGRSLRFFNFLVGKSHKTYFDELRDDSTVFTKSNITDEGIVTGIKDLMHDLTAIVAPYVVEWSRGDKWVRLDTKSDSENGG